MKKLVIDGEESAISLELADNFFLRLKGLMFRKKIAFDYAIAIIPCNSVHCAFMRFNISVAFVDKSGRVLEIRPRLRPFSAALGPKGTHWTLEMAEGAFEKHGVVVGKELGWGGMKIKKQENK